MTEVTVQGGKSGQYGECWGESGRRGETATAATGGGNGDGETATAAMGGTATATGRSGRFYSFFKLFTGLAIAALIA